MGWNDLIGQRLGRYEVTGELGRGGSSRVYRAFDPVRGGDVAIKVISNEAEDRQSFVRRFLREVQVVRQLHHPNIIEIYDSGETQELVYLVMRCLANGTLKQHFGRALPVPQAAGYISQMALALHHAHERGIIHRDVKPSNMLMDDEAPGGLVLTDFGIAKIQGLRGLTKSGTTIGTPEYMAPEQAEGREIDRRADIYSLGCVLYEALAGRPPFTGATPVSVLYQQVHARPSYIRGFNPDVPLELARIIERALAKEAPERFATAEQFAQVLRPFLSESPRAASNRMTEVPAPSNGIWTAPDFPGDAIPLPGESDPGAYGGASLLYAGGSIASQDTDLSLAPARDLTEAETLPSHPSSGPLAPGETERQSGRPTGRPAISSAPLRLPAKGSGPLPREVAAAGNPDAGILETLDALSRAETGADAGEAPTLVPPGRTTGRTRGVARPTGAPPVAATWADAEQARGEASVAEATPPPWVRPRITSRPVPTWEPVTDEIPTMPIAAPRRARGGTRSDVRGKTGSKTPFLVAAALAIVVAASFAGWLSYMVLNGHGGASTHGGSPQATSAITPSAGRATPSPTASGTATPNASPTTAPTPNAQALLDNEAAASFRTAFLGAYPDQSCITTNGTSQFAAGQSIYLNLCTSRTVASGPMTAVIRQNGANIFTLASGRYLAPGASYYFYSSFNLAPGNYAVVITMTIRGHVATARTLYFTVS